MSQSNNNVEIVSLSPHDLSVTVYKTDRVTSHAWHASTQFDFTILLYSFIVTINLQFAYRANTHFHIKIKDHHRLATTGKVKVKICGDWSGRKHR